MIMRGHLIKFALKIGLPCPAWQVRLWVCVLGMRIIAPVSGAEFKGDTKLGVLNRQVEFKGDILKETAGETHNDERLLNLQLKLNVEEMGSSKDRLLLDVRSKRDSYGLLERENLRLSNYDRQELRTLAYQRPWESNRFYFTLGRFTLPEANILGNDGADFGYRPSKTMRYGLFAGQAPRTIITPLYVDPETRKLDSNQAGVYLNYEMKEGVEESSFLTNAIVQAPSYDITDAQNHSYYYPQGMWTLSSIHRLGSLVHFDFAPKSNLRRGYLSYALQTEKLRFSSYLQQTNTEDYLIKQVLQDTLKPSAVQSLNLGLRYNIASSLAIDLTFSQGKRTADGLTRTETAFGLLLPRLLGDSSSTRFQVGTRKNFQSQDKFSKISYDYFARSVNLGLSYMIIDEKYQDGATNKRTIANLEGGLYFFDDVRAALGYQLENDNQIKANAFFFMVGYRFGSGLASATRTKPARFEGM